MAICELVGGPRDGEVFAVPGGLPPERIRVLDTPGGPLIMWHIAARNLYKDVDVVELVLDDTPTDLQRTNGNWRYLWPRQDARKPG